MSKHVIEMVSFKLLEGVSDEQFMEAAEAITMFAKEQPGFVCRHLSKDKDGTWLEHIEWESMTDAEAAAAKFTSEPSLAPAGAAIDGSTVVMKHNELVLTA